MLETETEWRTVTDNNLENTRESTLAISVWDTNFISVVTFDILSGVDIKLKIQLLKGGDG